LELGLLDYSQWEGLEELEEFFVSIWEFLDLSFSLEFGI
jgi:hypothetical protein